MIVCIRYQILWIFILLNKAKSIPPNQVNECHQPSEVNSTQVNDKVYNQINNEIVDNV